MYKILFLPLFLLLNGIYSDAQNLNIINLEGYEAEVVLLDADKTKKLIEEFDGYKVDSLQKEWTARTYQLSNGKVLIEFYDGQSALLKDAAEFERINQVRFVKNSVDRLKKNISYKIEIPIELGNKLIKSIANVELPQYGTTHPFFDNYTVYKLKNSQILYLDSSSPELTAIYKDIKTLASDRSDIAEVLLEQEDDEYYMKQLAAGVSDFDFDVNLHMIYPKYLDEVIENHGLTLRKKNMSISDFKSNLYQSDNGYWMVIDKVNQKNGAGRKMSILDLWIFDELSDVRKAEELYASFEDSEPYSKHFYQDISNKFGKNFPLKVDSLILELPGLLNFEESQLTLDEKGLKIIDEAIKWNHNNWKAFDSWFPSVLAYYGKFYIKTKNIGKWESVYDKEYDVWIPQITLEDGSSAFDMREFYKSLLEWPSPLKWAGDYEGFNKKRKK